MGQWREVRASKASIKIDRSGVCHNVASVSRDYVPQVTLFPTGRYSVRLSHRPELAVPRGKESVATPQSAPRRTLRLGLVVRKNPLSTLDCQKVAWDSTLIYFPFLLLLQVAIHSLQLCSLASLLLWYFQSRFTLSFCLFLEEILGN